MVYENRFSLDQASQAHAHLESGKYLGKVILEN